MNAKRCKKLRAAFRVWDASEQRWTTNAPAYKKAKKLEAQRLAAMRGGQKPKPVACRTRKNLLTGAKPQPMASSAWKRTGPLIVVKSRRQTHDDHRCDEIRHAWPKHVLDTIALEHPVGVA